MPVAFRIGCSGWNEVRRLQFRAEQLAERWRDIFADFNNDPEGMAVTSAQQELRALMIASIEGREEMRRMR